MLGQGGVLISIIVLRFFKQLCAFSLLVNSILLATYRWSSGLVSVSGLFPFKAITKELLGALVYKTCVDMYFHFRVESCGCKAPGSWPVGSARPRLPLWQASPDTAVPAAPATAPTSRHEAATTQLPPSAADTANPADPAMPCRRPASPRRQEPVVHFLLRQNKGTVWTDSDGTGFPSIPGPLRTVRETVKTRQEQIQFKWRHPGSLLSSLFNWYLFFRSQIYGFLSYSL